MPGSLLRVATAGSVDDGKSTLIGRLLHDSKSIFEDQLAAVADASTRRGVGFTDLALLTDGLRAEREQGITIDVAYRYFATPRRTFIVADTPGHVQYTRNMVTGASTAHAAVVLVDARKGMTEQSRRHTAIAGLLRVPHLVLAVNKIDLVGYDAGAFHRVVEEFRTFAEGLGFDDVVTVPVSALHGDNIVARSERMPWYEGPALLEHLEQLELATAHGRTGSRLAVQYVVRAPQQEYRGYAGQLSGDPLQPGAEVVVLPGGARTTVSSIDTFDGPAEQALPGQSVVLRLADDVDVSRGDLIAAAAAPPELTQELTATVCWVGDGAAVPGARYAIKHTTRSARAVVTAVEGVLDLDSLQLGPADRIGLNGLGRLRVRTTVPLAVDCYERNRTTGSLLFIDEASGATVGAGMVEA